METEFTKDGLKIESQDLGSISPEEEDDGRLFHHNGSSEIDLTGGTTEQSLGFYIWDHSEGKWYPPFNSVDLLDGKQAGDFIHRDGSLPMEAQLDLGNYGLINLDKATGGTGSVHLNSNNIKIQSETAGANIRLIDSNDLLIAEGIEGGGFNVPNGELQEAGNRVATRTWTNENADVPNADHADNSSALDGLGSSAFLHVSGDQMEGPLDLGGFDLNDGGTTKYNATDGEFVQSALGGPASSLSSYPLSAGDLAEDYTLTSRFPLPASDLDLSMTPTWTGQHIFNSGISIDSGGLDVEGVTDLKSGVVVRGNFNIQGNSLTNAQAIQGTGDQDINLYTEGHSIGFYNSTDSEDILRGYESGNVEVANGELSEQGNRVATRTWTTNNFNNYTFSESYLDLTDRSHGNEDHDATFLDDTDVTSVSTASGYELTVNGDTYQFNN